MISTSDRFVQSFCTNENILSTIENIGFLALNNGKESKILCKELLNNSLLGNIENVISNIFHQQKTLNNQIGILTVYRVLLEVNFNENILIKALEAALSNKADIQNKEEILNHRLKLFEIILTKQNGLNKAIEKIINLLTKEELNSENLVFIKILMKYNSEELFNSLWNSFTDYYKILNSREKEIKILLDLLVEIDENKMNRFIIKSISDQTYVEHHEFIPYPTSGQNFNLILIKCALEKNLFIHEIFETSCSIFQESSSRIFLDCMQYPYDILKTMIHCNCKRSDIEIFLKEMLKKYQSNSQIEMNSFTHYCSHLLNELEKFKGF